jgi:hypothetical protein
MTKNKTDLLGTVFDLALKTAEELGGTNLPMELIAQRIHNAHAAAGITDPQRLYAPINSATNGHH